MKIYRYMVFTAATYYSGFGWKTFRGSYATLEAARLSLKQNSPSSRYAWWQIVDLEEDRIIEEIVIEEGVVKLDKSTLPDARETAAASGNDPQPKANF